MFWQNVFNSQKCMLYSLYSTLGKLSEDEHDFNLMNAVENDDK